MSLINSGHYLTLNYWYAVILGRSFAQMMSSL